MISIMLNGKQITTLPSAVLADLLQEYEFHGNHFAIAVNECFVPRSAYQDTQLQDGDRVEVLTAMQGG